MTESAPANETAPSLESQVIAIFTETHRVIRDGGKRFPLGKENMQQEDLTQAVGWLSVASLAELVQGKWFEDIEGPGSSRLKASVDLWSDVEIPRKLHSLAYSAYVKARSEEIDRLLTGKVISAVTREGLSSAVSHSDGHFETSGDSPSSARGTFHGANANTGEITLLPDVPTEEVKYWKIGVISSLTGEQRADIEIEETSLTV